MDEPRNCTDCHQPFVFAEGEQRFFDAHGWEPPKRCQSCRDSRKLENKTGTRTVYREDERLGR